MSVAAVDRTIRILCAEILGNNQVWQEWRLLTEEELFYEACVCIFSSQTEFEIAEAAAQRLRNRGLLQVSPWRTGGSEYERRVSEALSQPLEVERGGKTRQVRFRFTNRSASLLAATVKSIYVQGESLRKILHSAHSAQKARELLVELVWGFGPKQASLFLRRVGYCANLAVLDTHILEYLRVSRGIDPKPSALSRLSGYECIEAEFQRVAEEFGHPIGCVDLAMWVTMRVAKREAIW